MREARLLDSERDNLRFSWPLFSFRCTDADSADFQIVVEEYFRSPQLHLDTQQGRSEVLVLERDESIVAAASYAELGSDKNGVFIEAFGVHIEQQGQGLANQLFEALLARIRDDGYSRATWRVHQDNDAMLRISRSRGASERPCTEDESLIEFSYRQ